MYSKPTLIIDELKCRNNIKNMVNKAKRNKVDFRPHFKTHQSLEIGNWFREQGVTKITVSSVDMATYFANGGWNDITIAFPVNILEIDQINTLAATVTLNLLVESVDVVEFLQSKLIHEVNAFIKINIGNDRAGLEPDNYEGISELIDHLDSCESIKFKGFLGHAGQSYACRNQADIQKVHLESISLMSALKDRFKGDYPDLCISVGDTPTCAVAEDFSKVDEIRPGVFVFFDSIMLNIGCCSESEIAAVVACPAVAIHKEKNEIIVYGGRVHLASDILTESDGRQIYGRVVENAGNGWGTIQENVFVKKISQEHGVISGPSDFIESVSVGDIIKLIPNHICTAASMFNHYITTEGKKINRLRI